MEYLMHENEILKTKLNDFKKLTEKSLTLKSRFAEIEKLRDENQKLKIKLLKYNELNVKSVSIESATSIIDDLKKQVQNIPLIISENNFLRNKIKQLEEIIERDNNLKLQLSQFNIILAENTTYKSQLQEYNKLTLDHKLLIEQHLLIKDLNINLNLEVSGLKSKISILESKKNNLEIDSNNIKEEFILLKESFFEKIKEFELKENKYNNKKEKIKNELKIKEKEYANLQEELRLKEIENITFKSEIPILKQQIMTYSSEPIIISSENKWKGINTDMVLYGNNKIIAINNKEIQFKIIHFDKNNIINEYKICNENDGSIYVLKIFNRKFHLLNELKVEKEYELFSEYFMKFNYYGYLKIDDNNYSYIISKTYNTNLNNLSNVQKYNFLINNLKFLEKLQKYNMFYPNYNIENIGYDNYNDDEMNIVLTNYDENSLYKIEENENIFKRFNILKIRNEIILKLNIINKPSYHIEYIEQLNKFSVQSINQIIEILKIQFNLNKIPLPANRISIVTKRQIGKISSNNVGNDLNLEEIDYDKIPSYAELIEVFEWIYESFFIK